MTLALAGLILLAIGVPHLLALERTSAWLAACICLAALALRALVVLFAAILVVLSLPATELFPLLTHWCLHTMLPFAAAHLPLDGHAFGGVALALPALVIVASLARGTVGLWRTGRRVRTLLAGAVGPGPRESLVLADGDVLVAAAGLRRPRVVVSAGALLALDDEELAASLDHEHGHIARRHRYVLVAAELCRALARFLPGTRATVRELVFHLERDADRYALARRHDPAALASAICKAAVAPPALASPALGLGGGVVTRRVRLLLDADHGQTRQLAPRALATGMVALVALGAAALPSAAHAGMHQAGHGVHSHGCPK